MGARMYRQSSYLTIGTALTGLATLLIALWTGSQLSPITFTRLGSLLVLASISGTLTVAYQLWVAREVARDHALILRWHASFWLVTLVIVSIAGVLLHLAIPAESWKLVVALISTPAALPLSLFLGWLQGQSKFISFTVLSLAASLARALALPTSLLWVDTVGAYVVLLASFNGLLSFLALILYLLSVRNSVSKSAQSTHGVARVFLALYAAAFVTNIDAFLAPYRSNNYEIAYGAGIWLSAASASFLSALAIVILPRIAQNGSAAIRNYQLVLACLISAALGALLWISGNFSAIQKQLALNQLPLDDALLFICRGILAGLIAVYIASAIGMERLMGYGSFSVALLGTAAIWLLPESTLELLLGSIALQIVFLVVCVIQLRQARASHRKRGTAV